MATSLVRGSSIELENIANHVRRHIPSGNYDGASPRKSAESTFKHEYIVRISPNNLESIDALSSSGRIDSWSLPSADAGMRVTFQVKPTYGPRRMTTLDHFLGFIGWLREGQPYLSTTSKSWARRRATHVLLSCSTIVFNDTALRSETGKKINQSYKWVPSLTPRAYYKGPSVDTCKNDKQSLFSFMLVSLLRFSVRPWI